MSVYLSFSLVIIFVEMTSIQGDIYAVGRIGGEADTSEVLSSSSKLTEGAIYLDTSRNITLDTRSRILLQFDPQLGLRGVTKGSGGLGIFPGALVALKGKNGSGNTFVVNEILSASVYMAVARYFLIIAHIVTFSAYRCST